MNPRKNTLLSLMLLGALLAPHAKAQSNGTQGAQDQDGQLRDFDKRYRCTTKSGRELLETMPMLRERLDALKKVYWYFGFALEREVARMTYCFTDADFDPNHMPRVDDRHSVLLVTPKGETEFVGVRIFETKVAYIREPKYLTYPDIGQAMLLIHEAAHSFIPLRGVEARDFKLRSFIADLTALVPSIPSALYTLEQSMGLNKINFPLKSKVKRNIDALEFALGTPEKRRADILSRKLTPNQILTSSWRSGYETLAQEDQDYLRSISGSEADIYFKPYCEQQDEEVLKVLRSQKNERFNIDLYCLALPDTQEDMTFDANPTILGMVSQKLTAIYHSLKNLEVGLDDNGRIVVSGGIKLLSQVNDDVVTPANILKLAPIQSIEPGAELSEDTKLWVNTILKLAQSLDPKDWEARISQNGALREALSDAKVVAQLQNIKPKFADEKEAALRNVPFLYQKFKKTIASGLTRLGLHNHAEAWNRMTK